MLFRILGKEKFRSLIEVILESNEIIAPKRVGSNASGEPIHQFLPIDAFDEMDLDYRTTEYSAKTYFLPYRENLCSFNLDDGDWQQEISYRIQPRAIIGLRAYDINALLKLDKVFIRNKFPSPYYVSRRENTFIVGLDHDPLEDEFSQSMGTDIVTHGFDLFLTDLGDRYFVAIASDRGFNLLNRVEVREVTDDDTNTYKEVRRRILAGFKTKINVHNLPNLLDLEFTSEVWEKWGKKCLSCGSCAMVCPTCYCYGVNEEVSMDFSKATRVKQLHSCNLLDFAEVAGGHNFRPDQQTRLKYRYYHQHRGFVEDYDEPKCVGCNRCGRVCLAGISPAAVIKDLYEENL
ncbi:MAG: 4Fe-4S dicluster domain-containing protein [Candidatus Nealsonbacteria bacterium]|nr:4Fe-4S dicluster domain-containing protein [Candidatus Nealsonbacteria bacterium]